MKYGSVCSGIESASMAWEPLGMEPVWFAEVEAFPSAVLAHHWPTVINLGDMCNLPHLTAQGLIDAPDILVGGTPCQAFSVAGARKGLKDERGQLTLKYVELANEIDKQRKGDECVIVWENVPGVLSSKDNAFGCFLAALAGEERPLEPSGKKWTNAGVVYGPKRSIAWRILDAQYFGVAQRRRRVFVVASARDGFDPAKVLFESESMRRDSKPSRKEGQSTTSAAGGGFTQSSFGAYRPGCGTLRANGGDLGGGSETLTTCAFFSSEQRGEFRENTVGACLQARDNKGFPGGIVLPITDKATRHAGKTGRGSGNGLGVGKPSDPSPTLTAGDKHAVCFHQNASGELRESKLSYTLNTNSNASGRNTALLRQSAVVRKMTPIECERLQGFPDNHTRIPWRGKPAAECPDGPRYKALGNSKAVPVIRWVGERIIKELNK